MTKNTLTLNMWNNTKASTVIPEINQHELSETLAYSAGTEKHVNILLYVLKLWKSSNLSKMLRTHWLLDSLYPWSFQIMTVNTASFNRTRHARITTLSILQKCQGVTPEFSPLWTDRPFLTSMTVRFCFMPSVFVNIFVSEIADCQKPNKMWNQITSYSCTQRRIV